VGMFNNLLIKKFFKKYDTKKDGVIDIEEFIAVMKSLIWKKWHNLSYKLLKQ